MFGPNSTVDSSERARVGRNLRAALHSKFLLWKLWRMSGQEFTFSEIDLPAAVRGLREALGRSPEVMARLLGCSLPAYQKWELGTVTPGGEWLVRMLQLCPDEETRNAFRIRAERRAAPRPSRELTARVQTPPTLHELEDLWQTARHAVDTMYDSARQGNSNAALRLKDFTHHLESAANYYRQTLEAEVEKET